VPPCLYFLLRVRASVKETNLNLKRAICFLFFLKQNQGTFNKMSRRAPQASHWILFAVVFVAGRGGRSGVAGKLVELDKDLLSWLQLWMPWKLFNYTSLSLYAGACYYVCGIRIICLSYHMSGLTHLSPRSPTARPSLPSTARTSSASIAASPSSGTRIRISRAARWCRWLTMRRTAT
jgi:hypothetical protein